MMFETATYNATYGNGDSQMRIRLGVGGLLHAEKTIRRLSGASTPMLQAYEAWAHRIRDGYVRLDEFLLEPNDAVSTYMVDVQPEHPQDYRFLDFSVLYVQGLDGTRLSEHPIAEFRRDLAFEYLHCKTTGEPDGYRITHDFAGFKRDYLRLFLPLCDHHGAVTMLACVSRHLEVPAGSLQATPSD